MMLRGPTSNVKQCLHVRTLIDSAFKLAEKKSRGPIFKHHVKDYTAKAHRVNFANFQTIIPMDLDPKKKGGI